MPLVFVQRPEVNASCLPLSLLLCSLERGHLTEPHCLYSVGSARNAHQQIPTTPPSALFEAGM